jgi:hypothetical protein
MCAEEKEKGIPRRKRKKNGRIKDTLKIGK